MMLKQNPIRVPPGLKSSKKLWKDITTQYIEWEPHHLKLLHLICKTWDEIIEAQDVLAEVGKYFVDRYGQPKEHPAADAERKNKSLFMRLVRELGLDLAPPEAKRKGRY